MDLDTTTGGAKLKQFLQEDNFGIDKLAFV